MGETVDDYEIVAKLKAGGMATLYLGRRTGAEGFSRHLAIKVVHDHLASDPTFVQMFVDEALLSAKIHHPNVVHVEELRQVGDRHFLVMEYVHGCSLSALLNALRRRRRTLSPELATYIAVKVAEGLHAAHETKGDDGTLLGVVHRDVTPQNVLLAYRGHVKLIDFGVAKARGRAQQTTGASLKGKIGYMSPEQAFGKPVDRRTDVYALGVVLWETLTGRRAFTADNDFALLELVRDPKLPPASSLNPAVPAAIDAVIARATARDIDQRFETAQQLRKALAQALPSALALDASDLESLLAATLGEEMDAERRVLPASVSGIVSMSHLPAPADAEQIVETLTVSAADLAASIDDGADPRSGPSGVRARAPDVGASVAPSGTMALPKSQGGARQANGEPRRRAPWRAALAVAGLLAAGAGALASWWVVGPGSSEIEATELPRSTETAPPESVTASEAPSADVAPSEPAEPIAAPAEAQPSSEREVPANDPSAASAEIALEEETDEETEEAEPPEEAEAADEAPRRPRTRRRPRRRVPRPRPLAPREPSGGVPLADEF